MQMPEPQEAHRKLDRLVGKWVGQETIHPSPFDPQGGMATARIHNRSTLNGFVVVQDYEQERNGQLTFAGHGVFWYDATAQQYCMTWFDSMGMPPNVFRGKLDGDILHLHSSAPQNMSRATFDISQANRYTFKMEVSMDGNQWFPFMEGEYDKKG